MADAPRYAALDIGSNTVKLLIAERADGDFRPIFEEAHACRLSQGFARKRLKKAAVDRTVNALKYFLLQCRRFEADSIATVGTAILREAANSHDFLARAASLGLPVEVLSGEDEARLSYLAVRNDPRWADSKGLLVVDIGGGSTELAWEADGDDLPRVASLAVGAVRLTEKSLPGDPPTAESVHKAARAVQRTFRDLPLPDAGWNAVGVGGTCTNIGSVAAHAAGMPDNVHGRKIDLRELDGQIALYSGMPVDRRRAIEGLDPARADIILAGSIILREVMRRAAAESLRVSNRGLRWGLLYDRFGD